MLNPGGHFPTRHWHVCDDGRIQCDVCPRACRLREGQRGFCFVRSNQGQQIVLTTYGYSSGFCVDPIEKKPLHHFLPGTSVLSFGTAGCNLGCRFCQNWDISKSRQTSTLSASAGPDAIAEKALDLKCRSVAFTYNDPVVFMEYAMDVADACRDCGIQSVAVSAGYMTPQAREAFYPHIDAANIDLKGFTEDFYARTCAGSLQPVLDTLHYLVKETSVWVEITTLLIPGSNDSDDELNRMSEWIYKHLGPRVPLHFSAFHPDWKMLDRPSTPHATLRRAREIAMKQGLEFVYVGNVHDREGDSTWCPECGGHLIGRDWYEITFWNMSTSGVCPHCHASIPGVFESSPGNWGRRRLPVMMNDKRV